MKILETNKLEASYGDFKALFGVDVVVNEGEIVSIIGSNGAGKTTFMKSIVGLLPSSANAVMFEGKPIGNVNANIIVKSGICLVPEGRRLFPSLSVEENLLLGAYSKRKGPWSLEKIYKLFPILKEKRHIQSTSLSGGQQQMVAVGRALMSNPKLLLCDELSLGLAPIIIKDIYKAISSIHEDGTTVLIVEQDINQALAVSDRVYCFQEGRISLEGTPSQLSREKIKAAYFGL